MTTEREAQLEALLRTLIERVKPEKVVLFGSYADDTATPQSDIDLLVILESDLRRDRRQEMISRALRPRRVPVDILAYTPAEVETCMANPASFVRHILTTGKIIYERHTERMVGESMG
ncbi:MAG TPA: nucleotidyltransferase domain-containing protein [Anaerolineae bacterium]|nr:nucleotidyltransferase domain-containing protein [Anaerolineae bacterium]